MFPDHHGSALLTTLPSGAIQASAPGMPWNARYSARGRGRQALASLTSLRLAGHAGTAAALRFLAAAQIAHCERS